MPSTGMGMELVILWGKFFKPWCPIITDGPHDGGIDIVLTCPPDLKLTGIQVKTSLFHVCDHFTKGLRCGRIIPVVVGQPPHGSERLAVVKSLLRNGCWAGGLPLEDQRRLEAYVRSITCRQQN